MKTLFPTLILVFTQAIAWGQIQYLEGGVFDEEKKPIQGVEVKLFKAGELFFVTKTNLQGHYKFSTSAGNYDLFFQHKDYVSTTFLNVKIWEATTNPFSVVLEVCDRICCASISEARETIYNPNDLTSNSCFSTDQIRRFY